MSPFQVSGGPLSIKALSHPAVGINNKELACKLRHAQMHIDDWWLGLNEVPAADVMLLN